MEADKEESEKNRTPVSEEEDASASS